MKTFRKLIMGLLVLTMILGMGITAYAADKSIVIKEAKDGQTYNAYRVFDFFPADESSPKAGGVYKLSPKFAGFESYTYNYVDKDNNPHSVDVSTFFTIGDNDIIDPVGLVSETDAALFGRAAVQYAKDNSIGNDGTTTADADGTATISISEYGYYVVDSSLGSAVAVNTTTPNVEIKEKNDVPNLDKKVTGATNEALVYTDLTGAKHQIGDTVEFTLDADLKVGGYDYVMYDCATEGFTLEEITDANITFDPVNPGLTWTIDNRWENPKNGRKGFLIKFNGEPNQNSKVIVKYSAVINENAVINPSPNINEAFLTYGNEKDTTHKETIHYTYPVEIKKIAKGDPDEKLLKDAKFKVIREFDGSEVKLTKIDDSHYKVDPNGTVTEFITTDTKNILIEGFAPEKYVLVETQAPKGYNLLTGVVTVNGVEYQHAQELVVSENSKADAVQVEKVEDGTGLVLPSTGGIGTTIFYIVGGILIVAGIAYFIVRRKADAE